MIDTVAEKIIKLLLKSPWKKMERNHKILKLMNAIGIGELKGEFDSIYAHTLMEYAVDANPTELTFLFAQKEVKKKFENLFFNKANDQQLLSDLQRTFEHQLKTNKKLSLLTNIYKSAKDMEIELKQFREIYEYYTNRTATPFELKKYKEDYELKMEVLRKKYDYQVENYLIRLRDDFQKEFLANNYYIYLNAETQIEMISGIKKNGRPEKGETHMEKQSVQYRPIDKFINQWLNNDSENILVIIGEYGTGKTTLSRHIAHQLACNFLEASNQKTIVDKKKRVPLYFPLRYFEKNVEPFIINQFNSGGITDIDFADFRKRIKNDEFVILLDGFDEMSTQKIDEDEKSRNFDQIRNLIGGADKSKIILTTRCEYFRSDEELQNIFSHKDSIECRFIQLMHFDDDQIQKYLTTHTKTPEHYWEQIQAIFELHDLAKRPVLLQYIIKYLPDLIEENRNNERICASDLYQKCIEDELRRKNTNLKFLIPGKYRFNILQKLAVWMFIHNTLIFDPWVLENELNLKQYFKIERPWELEKYLNEFLAFTFLIPESSNRYRISHKSFLEYLTAKEFVEELNNKAVVNFGKKEITDDIIQFMVEQNLDKETLMKMLLNTHNLQEDMHWHESNTVRVLLRLDKDSLKGKDLSGCQLNSINFIGCNLESTNFKNTHLNNCWFNGTILNAKYKDIVCKNSSLDLSNSGLTDISFLKRFNELIYLDLSGNQISDISPIAELTHLSNLYLSSNQIVNISAIKPLLKLSTIDISNNPIADLIDTATLKNLKRIIIHKNQIPKNQKTEIKKMLPELEIYVK